MAKTPLSLSHDPRLVGRPEGYVLPVIEVRLSAGAGFVYPLCGEIRTMPGLSASPAGERIDIDADGRIYGLF
jgi:formate--tetrahydrofolate ligase